MSAWEALKQTPIDEVRRRAAIVDQWNDIESVEVPGGTRYAWNDGGGQSSGWFFADDGKVLLLTYEHESALNFYDGDYAAQLEVFRGVPAELVALVANRPESYEFHNVTETSTGQTLPHASGVFWFDGASWHIADGLLTYCERNGIALFGGTGFSRDVGFDYAVGDCLFGREFTPEAVIAEQVANGWYEEAGEREEALQRLRAVFDAHTH
ncbi:MULTISPECIES: hypothetical protein [Mycobacteroides]|nr:MULTISPECIES: hypothetical protein [Mycobacteroides]MBE5465056.1 hypothetical protein [Mycobacteroides abscessus]MDM2386703.1 hypothetical protein [Mycobacteroides abscessus]MDM2391993.1 hypothetical protein [Mycobacteroides abscessus]SIF65531.1 Uncharacterised protein [Mycobacteroides abscessus subsp. abscessus]SIF91175.1 Uncharacterised protein [Mycobacteroides abscessus subsp. abscessus]